MKRNTNFKYVRKSLLMVLTFVFSVSFCFASKDKSLNLTPDFAFPKQVISQSDDAMLSALRDGKDLPALRALMDNCIAFNILDSGTKPGRNIALMDSVSACLTSPYKELGFLLQADYLRKLYLDNKWVYDRRKLASDAPYPEDPTEWNREMFQDAVYSLVVKASSNPAQSLALPIEKIASLLSLSEETKKIGMTVNDFIALKASDILLTFGTQSHENIIPFFPSEIPAESQRIKILAKNMLGNFIDSNLKDRKTILAAEGVIQYLKWLNPEEEAGYILQQSPRFKETEGEGLLLLQNSISLSHDSENSETNTYNQINSYLKRFPKSIFSASLGHRLDLLSQKRMEIEVSRLILPGTPVPLSINCHNLSSGYILVYELKANQADKFDNLITKNFNPSAKPLQVVPLRCNGEIPFQHDTIINLSGLNPGLYMAVPSETASLKKGWNKNGEFSFSTFRVTDISLLTSFDSNEKNSGKVYVVKASNQNPLEGATVRFYQNSDTKPVATLKTDSNGSVDLPTNGYYRIEAEYGASKCRGEAGVSYFPDNNKTTPHASFLTDLSVYRPGDTLNFAVFAWNQNKNEKSLVKDTSIEIVMRDANYREVEKQSLQLDSLGRASGSFIVPQRRLLGIYHLSALIPDLQSYNCGSIDFEVSDYKLPEFEVSLTQIPSSDSNPGLEFKGSALTYSGMPVTDASVAYTVEYLPLFFLRGSYESASYSATTVTDNEGVFHITLPIDGLKNTRFQQGKYRISAEVTSPSGDTQSGSLFFYLGTATTLNPSIPDKLKIEADSVRLHIPAYNIESLPEIIKADFRFVNYDNPNDTISGSFMTPSLVIPASSLPSGKYRLEFKAEDAKDFISTETVFYRPDDTQVPYYTPLWIPENEYVFAPEDKSVEIKFGGSRPDASILYMISDADGMIERNWINVDSSLNSLKVPVPAGKENVFVTLAGSLDFQLSTGRINLVSSKTLEKMDVETVSFRENITAGDSEHWKFKFKFGNVPAADIASFAVMTDKALNSIRDFRWNLNIGNYLPYSKSHLGGIWQGRSYSWRNFNKIKSVTPMPSLIPEWNTYNYPLASGGMMIHDAVMFKAASRNMASQMEAPVTTEVKEEEADYAVADTGGSESGVENLSDEKEDVKLRPVEMPVAFFLPDLTTDSEGVMDLEFTVPNFNTSWQLQIAGYNEDLLNASLTLNTTASKPVMVKSNLPKFLLTGDKTRISAMVYNNSPEIKPVSGKIEILNPFTKEVLKTAVFKADKLNPSEGRLISIDYDVPDDLTLLAIRSYALEGSHSDGEQGFVPVLPSSTPVVESSAFYMTSSQEEFSMKLPKYKSDANVVLRYCDNPLWEVLLSLPVLQTEENKSSLSVARSLFSMMIGNHIVGSDSRVAEALSKVLNSDDSSLTQSNLEKDENIKTVGLQMTPWINDAENETALIRSLSFLLDKELVAAKISGKISVLSSLQNSDGGWSWFDGMKSSSFITSEIIGLLGWLNQNNLLAGDLQAMASKAIGYYDNILIDQKSRGVKFDNTGLLDYFYHRSAFDVKKDKVVKNIEEETVKAVIKDWRYMSLGKRAMAAILLSRSGETKEARTILSSLEEFTGQQRSLLDLSLMLEAFSIVEPDSPGLEATRQLLLMKKETQSWSDNAHNAAVIYSLMATSEENALEKLPPRISINGQELEIPASQTLTGNFTINLDPRKVSGKKLTVNRSAGLPAWGGIVSQQILPIKDIKPVSVENLSVEKSIDIIDKDGKVKSGSKFKKGDKIIVNITLTCNKDMEYVAVIDQRAACLQPDSWNSGICFIDGLLAYREIRSDRTSFFIQNLPAGKHILSYECNADREGDYSIGIVSVQSLYSPIQTAHSSGSRITITTSGNQ